MDGLLDLRLLDWTAVCWFVYHKRAPFSRQIKVRRASFVEFEGPAKPTDAALAVAATKAAAVTANRRDTVGRTPVSGPSPTTATAKCQPRVWMSELPRRTPVPICGPRQPGSLRNSNVRGAAIIAGAVLAW